MKISSEAHMGHVGAVTTVTWVIDIEVELPGPTQTSGLLYTPGFWCYLIR